MHELGSSTRTGEQHREEEGAGYPDVHTIRLRQLKDEPEAMRELVSEARLTAIILKGTSDEYQLVKLSATKDLDSTLEQMEATMRNMFVNDISRTTNAQLMRWVTQP